jgi:hypothetical protein
LRASFARRMLQYVPAPPANSSFSAAAGTSVTGVLAGQAIGGAAPTWASTPSLNVFGGIAGSTTFSFSGGSPTSVVVEPGDTLPAWVTSVTTTGINWGTAATAGSAYSFRLRASNGFGASTSNVISGTVQAVSTGLWGTPYNYNTPATWGMYARDNTTRLGTPAHTIAYLNTGYVKSKDMLGVYNPTQDRIVYMGGDPDPWVITNVDGYNSGSGSNGTFWGSFALTDPRRIKRERGTPTDNSKLYAQRDDGPFLVHDESASRAVYFGSSTFGYDVELGRPWHPAPVSPVTYLSANSARFAGTVAGCPVGTKLRFEITHPVGGAVSMRGRVTAVSDAGGGNIDVTVSWHDPNCTFQAPQSVLVAVDPQLYAAGSAWTPTGPWQEDSNFVSYDEVKNRKQCRLLAFNYSTGEVTRLLFDLQGAATGGNRFNGQYLSATATGRGPEIWAFDKASQAATKYDLTALTATNYSLDTSGQTDTYTTYVNQGCSDDAGNIYVFSATHDKFGVVNVRGASPTYTVKAHDYPTRLYPSGASQGFICYAMVWNRDIRRVEMYCASDGDSLGGEAKPWLYLVDPSTTPYKVELIGNTDDTGSRIRAATFVRVNKTPQETWMFGGNQDNALSADQKLRVFIAANKREWQTLTTGPHWYHSFSEFNGKATDAVDAVATATQVSAFPAPIFGHWVPEIGNDGLHTGKVYIRAGGDGDYGGNEVTILRLDQPLTGTTFDTQLNTVTSAADFALWRNRIRTGLQSGSTGSPKEVLLNPADLTEFQPVSVHTWHMNSFVPGYGYVESMRAPATIGGTTTTLRSQCVGLFPVLNGTVLTDNSYADNLWGASRFIQGDASPSLMTGALIAWSEAGASAGKWQRTVVDSNTNKRLACFNTTRNRLVGYNSQSSGEVQFYEWTPGAGSFVAIGSPIYPGSVTNNDGVYSVEDPGNHSDAIWWIEGDKYLIRKCSPAGAAQHGFLTYDRSNNTLVRNRSGAPGGAWNAICDAADAAKWAVTVAFDRARREAYWIVGQGTQSADRAALLYRSSFDDLWNWRPMHVRNSSELIVAGKGDGNTASVVGIKYAFVAGDFIYVCVGLGAGMYGPSSDIRAAKVLRLPIY